MADIDWLAGTSGLWIDGTAWTGGSSPGSTDTATIAAAPPAQDLNYVVTLARPADGSATQVTGLAISQAMATLELTSSINSTSGATLAVSSTASLTAGTLALNGGTLLGGTAATTQGSATVTASASFRVVLDINSNFDHSNAITNIEWNGWLNLSHGYVDLNALTVKGAINLSGVYSRLSAVEFAGFNGSGEGRLNAVNSQVSLYTANSSDYTLSNVAVFLKGSTLTASQGLTLTASTQISAQGLVEVINAQTITNAGHINVSKGGTALFLADSGSPLTEFFNRGTVSVSNGQSIVIDTVAGSNTGLLSVGTGGYLLIGNSGATGFSNTGALDIVGGTLSLEETLTTAQLHGFGITHGTLGIAGTLDNTGMVLTAGSSPTAAAANLRLDDGTIAGGTIINTGRFIFGGHLGPDQSNGVDTLSGVTFDGKLELDGQTLLVENGFTLAGTTPVTKPTISLSSSASLGIVGSEVLDGTAIILEGNSTLEAGSNYEATILQSTLTLGPKTVVSVRGAGGTLTSYSAVDVVINKGNINDNTAGANLVVQGLHNVGTIVVANGATLSTSNDIGSIVALTNDGRLTIGRGSTLALHTFNTGDVPDAPVNNGTIALSGATISQMDYPGLPAFPVLNTGTIQGNGRVDARIDNRGIVAASGGTLALARAVSGIGVLLVGTGATLDLSTTGKGQVAQFGGASGVLGLAPAAFLGRIGTFVAGDAIDLENTAGKSARFSGSSIVVSLTAGRTITLTTTSTLSGALATTSDGHGGTLLQYAGALTHNAGLATPDSLAGKPPVKDGSGRGWEALHRPEAAFWSSMLQGHLHLIA